MIDRLVVPLLDDRYQYLRDKKVLLELVVGALQLSEFHGNQLLQLAVRLGNVPELLGKIVSWDSSSGFLDGWIEALGTSNTPDRETLAKWTDVMAVLASGCTGSHHDDTKEILDQWTALKDLQDQLQRAQIDLKQNPQLGRISFVSDTIALFERFNLSVPYSQPTLSAAITQAETTLAAGILVNLSKSMPCRLCFARCNGESDTSLGNHRRFGAGRDGSGEGEGMLGGSLGLWKISLSAQAMRDLQQSMKEGEFYPTYLDLSIRLYNLLVDIYCRFG